MILTPNAFLMIGTSLVSRADKSLADIRNQNKSKVIESRFRSFYGIGPSVCAIVWEMMSAKNLHPKARPKHLLWALIFLKTYNTEAVIATIVGCIEKTLRRWIWEIIERIEKLYDQVIIFEKRLQTDGNNRWCTMTIDGTDFSITEPTPFSSRWYSHKFKSAGIRYEVGVSINGGDIVHTNGPYPCGSWPDISIFRDNLIDKLRENEMVEADRGYLGEPTKIRVPVDYATFEDKKMKARARSRHETVNKRFKQFGILKKQYRHKLTEHQKVFRSIVILTQLSIENGEGLFSVEYI